MPIVFRRLRAGRLQSAVALSLVVLAVLAGCGHTRSADSRPLSVGYSIREVQNAFAAAGLPLSVESSYHGISLLSPRDESLFDDLTVQVGPRSEVSGAIWVVFPVNQRPVRAGNVFVSYRPASPAGVRVRAAIAHLRHRR